MRDSVERNRPGSVLAASGNWSRNLTATALRIRRKSTASPATVLALCGIAVALVALNLEPVSISWAGGAVAVLATFVAVFHPLTWFFFLAASQIVPDPSGFPLTLAQLSVLIWAVTLPWNGCWRFLRSLGTYWCWVLPLITWYYVVFTLNRGFFYSPLMYAALLGAISYVYARRGLAQPHVLLLALASGMALSSIGYWGRLLELPVIAKVYEESVRGVLIERIGAGRGDANAVALNLPVAIAGFLALAIFSPQWCPSRQWSRRMSLLAVVTITIAVPALMGTVSRGGLYSMPLVLCGIAFTMFLTPRSLRLSASAIMPWVAVLGIICLLPFSGRVGQAVLDTYEKVQLRNAANERYFNTKSAFAGRSQVWSIHWDLLLKHPLFGVPSGETVDFGMYGVARVGESGVYAAAHNAFLDFGSSTGFPGMFLFALLFFGAPYRLYKTRGLAYAAPFIAVYLAVFFGFMSLSTGNWKSFWGLLALTLATARADHEQIPRRLVVPGRLYVDGRSRRRTLPAVGPDSVSS